MTDTLTPQRTSEASPTDLLPRRFVRLPRVYMIGVCWHFADV